MERKIVNKQNVSKYNPVLYCYPKLYNYMGCMCNEKGPLNNATNIKKKLFISKEWVFQILKFPSVNCCFYQTVVPDKNIQTSC